MVLEVLNKYQQPYIYMSYALMSITDHRYSITVLNNFLASQQTLVKATKIPHNMNLCADSYASIVS